MTTVQMIVLETKKPIEVRKCQLRFRDTMKIYDDLFNNKKSPYYHNRDWHKACLQKAREEFDDCLTMCEQELDIVFCLLCEGLKSISYRKQSGGNNQINGEITLMQIFVEC